MQRIKVVWIVQCICICTKKKMFELLYHLPLWWVRNRCPAMTYIYTPPLSPLPLHHRPSPSLSAPAPSSDTPHWHHRFPSDQLDCTHEGHICWHGTEVCRSRLLCMPPPHPPPCSMWDSFGGSSPDKMGGLSRHWCHQSESWEFSKYYIKQYHNKLTHTHTNFIRFGVYWEFYSMTSFFRCKIQQKLVKIMWQMFIYGFIYRYICNYLLCIFKAHAILLYWHCFSRGSVWLNIIIMK